MHNYTGLAETTAIFKTNPRLTGNVKFVVENNNAIHMTQLNESNKENSKLQYSKSNSFATNVSTFLMNYVGSNKFAIDNFDISSNNVLKSKAYQQYDLQYQYGAKMSYTHNKHRFFAPLWINSNKLPRFFVIAYKQKSMKHLSSKTNLSSSLKFEILKTFDLHNGLIKNIYDDIIGYDMYRNEPLIWNIDTCTVYGIDIVNKIHKYVSINTNKLMQTEYTLFEADNVLTNTFMLNNMIIQNLLNFEFEFEFNASDKSGAYEIVGFYCDDVNNINITNIITPQKIQTANSTLIANSMTLVKKYNSNNKAYEFTQFNANTAYATSYDVVLRKLLTPSVTLMPARQNRLTRFQVRRSIATGDYITINEQNISYTIYCDSVRNSDVFFKYSKSFATQIANINDALQRLNTKNVYIAQFNAAKQLVTIECQNSNDADDNLTMFIDAPDAWFPVINASTKQNIAKRKYLYEFTKVSTIENTILINNISTNLAGIDVNDIKYCQLQFNDDTTQILKMSNIVLNYADNNAMIIFASDFVLPDALINRILLTLYSTMYTEVCQMQFYNIAHIDASMQSFIIDSKHNALENLSLLYSSNYQSIIASVKNQFASNSDLPAIKTLSDNAIEFSNNVYDRLKEYDIQKFAVFNKINAGIVKWCSSKGDNSYAMPMSANVNIAYNHANMSPVFDSEAYHDIHSLQFDYFIIGTTPVSTNLLFEYTTANITSIAQLTKPNALLTLFRHSVNTSINEQTFTKYIDNFAKVFSKTSITNKCFALFRGVEYELPYNYVDYNFTVVHISTKNTLTPIVHELIDIEYKSIIIAIEYPITDTILTNIENEHDLFLSPKMQMRRYIYYTNVHDDNTANKIISANITAEIKIDNAILAKTTQRVFKNANVADFKITYNGITYFAVDINTKQNLANVFIENQNCDLHTDDISLTFVNIVDIQDTYIWVQNITATNGFNLQQEFNISGANLATNQNVNTIISLMFDMSLNSTQFNVSPTRYYPIAFSNFCSIIKNDTYVTKITKISNAIINSYLTTEQNSLSYNIVPANTMHTYMLQRYALNCTPLCTYVLQPLTLTLSIFKVDVDTSNTGMFLEGKAIIDAGPIIIANNTDTQNSAKIINPITTNIYLNSANVINDYGIFKIGDAHTLTTDDTTKSNAPVHTAIGETAYALIDYDTAFSPFVGKFNFYEHRNKFKSINLSDGLANHSNILSTFIYVQTKTFSTKVFNTNNLQIDIMLTIAQYLQKTFNMFNINAIQDFVEYMLTKYNYSITFTNDIDESIEPLLSTLNNADNKNNPYFEFDATYAVINTYITLT